MRARRQFCLPPWWSVRLHTIPNSKQSPPNCPITTKSTADPKHPRSYRSFTLFWGYIKPHIHDTERSAKDGTTFLVATEIENVGRSQSCWFPKLLWPACAYDERRVVYIAREKRCMCQICRACSVKSNGAAQGREPDNKRVDRYAQTKCLRHATLCLSAVVACARQRDVLSWIVIVIGSKQYTNDSP